MSASQESLPHAMDTAARSEPAASSGAAAYVSEFRAGWRFLAAAAIGQAAGYSIVNYINNVFTPKLIEELGWSRAEFALIGITAFLGILTQPIAGRLTDAFGVRRVALVGVICAPLVFFGFSAMSGALSQFFLISLVQVIVIGGTTSAVVYSRLIAQQFERARGVALAIAACAPPAAAAMCIPALSSVVENSGWRAGYMAVAICVAAAGVTAIFMIPASHGTHRAVAAVKSTTPSGYAPIFRDRAFRLVIVGMILCNLPFTLLTSQLKVVLLDRGVDSATGSMAVSLFAFSVLAGRMLCGAALDRFPTHYVAAICMGLPGLGLGLLAVGPSAVSVIAVAVVLLGLLLGAESDLLAYLVMKFFRLEIYSTVLGLVLGAIALAVATGSLLLSFTLELSGSYTPFLALTCLAAFAGGYAFLRLRRVAPNS